jgi:hypothetical protein
VDGRLDAQGRAMGVKRSVGRRTLNPRPIIARTAPRHIAAIAHHPAHARVVVEGRLGYRKRLV